MRECVSSISPSARRSSPQPEPQPAARAAAEVGRSPHATARAACATARPCLRCGWIGPSRRHFAIRRTSPMASTAGLLPPAVPVALVSSRLAWSSGAHKAANRPGKAEFGLFHAHRLALRSRSTPLVGYAPVENLLVHVSKCGERSFRVGGSRTRDERLIPHARCHCVQIRVRATASRADHA